MFWVGLGLIMYVLFDFTLLWYHLPIQQHRRFIAKNQQRRGCRVFMLTTTTRSLIFGGIGIHTNTSVPYDTWYKFMTSAKDGTTAGQYPHDVLVEKVGTHIIGRIPKLVPSSIDSRWIMRTPSNVRIEQSQVTQP